LGQATVQIVRSLRSFKMFESTGEHNILVQSESFEIGHRAEADRTSAAIEQFERFPGCVPWFDDLVILCYFLAHHSAPERIPR